MSGVQRTTQVPRITSRAQPHQSSLLNRAPPFGRETARGAVIRRQWQIQVGDIEGRL